MRVYIVDDYDCDCEVYPEDNMPWHSRTELVYEVPDDLVKEYWAINERREELKEKILLIERQCRLAEKLEDAKQGIPSKGFG